MRLRSAATLVEAGLVIIQRRGEGGSRDLDALLARIRIEVVPVSAEHARLAREGYARFGQGRHPAGLNFGDSFSYALAKATGQPLLFKGLDCSRTDVGIALVLAQH